MNLIKRLLVFTLTPLLIVGCTNLGDYKGRNVDYVLASINAPNIGYTFIDEPPCVLSGTQFYYEDGTLIEIYVEKNIYQEAYNTDCDWDIELFKKEKVYEVKIINWENFDTAPKWLQEKIQKKTEAEKKGDGGNKN